MLQQGCTKGLNQILLSRFLDQCRGRDVPINKVLDSTYKEKH